MAMPDKNVPPDSNLLSDCDLLSDRDSPADRQLPLLAPDQEAATGARKPKARKPGLTIGARKKIQGKLAMLDVNGINIIKGRAATHVLINENEYLTSKKRLPERNLIHLKLMNALLYFAGNQLADLDVKYHYAPLNRICDLIGFNSNNLSEIKDGLWELQDIAVEWDGYNDEGLKIAGKASLMSEIYLVGGNMCKFAFPTVVRRSSAAPTVFARINLALQNSFSSKHSLALYEFCRTYADQKQTPPREIDDFKKMFGVFSTQASWQYGVFKRDILKRAIDDVNKVSDIRISLREKRIRTQVTHVQFAVEEIVAAVGSVVEFTPEQTRVIDELMRHGMSDKNAQEVVLIHPAEAIRAAIQKTVEACASGRIAQEEAGGYLLGQLVNRPGHLRAPAGQDQLAFGTAPEGSQTGKEAS